MLNRALALSGLLAAAVVACSGPEPTSAVHGEDHDLIGGTPMNDGDLPSTLRIQNSCTAAKVGPKHILIAAHCVWKQAIDPKYVDGAQIQVTSAANAAPSLAPYQTLTIKHTHVGEEWVENCSGASTFCMGVGTDDEHRASDVAVVETVEEIANVPIAAVDVEPLQAGESVIVTGYGCQGSVGGYWSYSISNLKAGVVQLLQGEAILHSGSTVNEQSFPVITAHDLITPGPAWPTPGPGLCPGDSGGPLYRAKGGGATIVGVNASYTFSGNGGLPVTNWHTRLDRATGRNIAGWLASVGATVCEGETCPTRAPAASLSAPPPTPAQVADLVSDGRDVSCQKAALDTSKVQAAIDSVLSTNAFCMSLNGQRISVEDQYVYGSVAYCWLMGGSTLPTPEQVAAFPAAMEAKGFKGFTLQGNVIQGAIYSAACDSYPTGDAACQGSAPSLEKIAADVKQSSGQKVTCMTGAPMGPGGATGLNPYYVVGFSCQFSAPLTAQYQQYLTASMQQLRYSNVAYNPTTNTVQGYGFSLPCSVFGGP